MQDKVEGLDSELMREEESKLAKQARNKSQSLYQIVIMVK